MAARKKKALAKRKPAGAMTKYDYGEDAGKGYENQTQADIAIPFLSVLQTGSPQVLKKEEAFIDGAQPGMLFNTVTKELIDGEKGVIIVPCDTSHVFTEWVPRDKGGGFRGIHKTGSDYVRECLSKAESAIGRIPTPEGNELQETFYIFALLLDDIDSPEQSAWVMIPFTSTKIGKYKNIMSRLRTFKGNPPMFAHRLHLTSVPDSNQKGNFYNFEVKPAVDDDVGSSLIDPSGEQSELFAGAKEFMKQIRSGAARGAFETVDGGEDRASGDPHF